MSAHRRRGSAPYEFALQMVLFTCVATIGLTRPSAFHEALVGTGDAAVTAMVGEPPVRFGVPSMLAAPGAVVIPMWRDLTQVERQALACADGAKSDPWTVDACANPAAAPQDARPWASTPWGAE